MHKPSTSNDPYRHADTDSAAGTGLRRMLRVLAVEVAERIRPTTPPLDANSGSRPERVTVRVFHNTHPPAGETGHRPGDEFTEVYHYTDVPWADHEMLWDAFWMFALGHDPWGEDGPDARAVAYRDADYRPLAIGDVVAIGQRYYARAELGWEPIPALTASPAPERGQRGRIRARAAANAPQDGDGR